MGTLDLKLDIPDFNEKLNIEITIKKDGEVLVKGASPVPSLPRSGKKIEEKNISGNMMNIDQYV